MKYIFLTGSIVFGIVGISQAMDVLKNHTESLLSATPFYINLQLVSLSFQPFPGFVRVLLLSMMFFFLYLIWKKLKKLGIGKLWEYIPC